MDEAQQGYVEEIGVFFERFGLARDLAGEPERDENSASSRGTSVSGHGLLGKGVGRSAADPVLPRRRRNVAAETDVNKWRQRPAASGRAPLTDARGTGAFKPHPW